VGCDALADRGGRAAGTLLRRRRSDAGDRRFSWSVARTELTKRNGLTFNWNLVTSHGERQRAIERHYGPTLKLARAVQFARLARVGIRRRVGDLARRAP
jgi:hypothetical protein